MSIDLKEVFKQPLLNKNVQSFQKLTTYFIQKGKRSIIETKVRSFLKDNLKVKGKKKAY